MESLFIKRKFEINCDYSCQESTEKDSTGQPLISTSGINSKRLSPSPVWLAIDAGNESLRFK